MRLFLLADAVAVHTRRWALWFAARGHDVHVLSVNPETLDGYGSVQVHHLWKTRFGNRAFERALKFPFVLGRVQRLIRRHRPDLLHAHSAGGYSWIAMLSGFRPYFVTPWGTDLLVDMQQSPATGWLTRQSLRRAARVTTDAEHMIPILEGAGVSPDRILLHAFGTDVDLFSPGAASSIRSELGLTETQPIVISTRTLNPVHDTSTFVGALPAIQQAHPEAAFVIVSDGAGRGDLQRLASSLGLADAIHFTGMVEEARMRDLLRAAAIYVSVSPLDAGLASSTAEAMSIGLPVVITDVGDNRLWVPEGEGGFLVDGGDREAVARAVNRLLADAGVRRSFGERNRQKIIEDYNVDVELARVEQAYEAVVTNRARHC